MKKYLLSLCSVHIFLIITTKTDLAYEITFKKLHFLGPNAMHEPGLEF